MQMLDRVEASGNPLFRALEDRYVN